MNFKLLLGSILLTVACASNVFAVEQTDICTNVGKADEKTRTLCAQIEQLKALIAQSNMKAEDKTSILDAVNNYVVKPLSAVSSALPVILPVAVIGYIAYKLHVLNYVIAAGCGAAVTAVIGGVIVVGGIITAYLNAVNKGSHY